MRGVPIWKFYGYLTPARNAVVQQWWWAQHQHVRDEANDHRAYLEVRAVVDWKEPYFKRLGDGLGEIRFKVKNPKGTYRIYALCSWPAPGCCTFLHAGDKGRQDAIIKESRKRKTRLERGESEVHEFNFSDWDIGAPAARAESAGRLC